MKKILLLAVLLSNLLYGAEILKLVSLLDLNDTEALEMQVQNLNDANAAREDNNKTVLMYACWVGNLEAVKYLVSKGADVNAQDSGGATALHLAAWKGHNTIALYLLENGASGSSMSKDGMTPLDIALMKENKEIAEAIEKAAPKLKPLL
ncbi:Ankyrin [Sulfuricurvum kujiense DSM 16994]|uniref:Ankyrin n=1 Tax=Sulfuricurvum kujiense (strain ATCC BAA-921 / DSM 16994 / JCM 11577 / YK-1) TaxID=709032 RepID=E4TYP4_SULKY|nr:ankyrin repeat domain-containing protein [Sulfuricurvum kujiense]ADR34035.1 Ankyrin [Sulfuricurvum kujiense DSM 16994]